jgi:hypothetical protein
MVFTRIVPYKVFEGLRALTVEGFFVASRFECRIRHLYRVMFDVSSSAADARGACWGRGPWRCGSEASVRECVRNRMLVSLRGGGVN